MSEYIETVTITTKAGPVRINASDYDPEKHKLAKVIDSNTQTVVTEPLGEKIAPSSIQVSIADKTAIEQETSALNLTGVSPSLIEPTLSPEALTVKPTLFVQKKGKKFIVVSATGERANDAQYETEKEAWNAVLTG